MPFKIFEDLLSKKPKKIQSTPQPLDPVSYYFSPGLRSIEGGLAQVLSDHLMQGFTATLCKPDRSACFQLAFRQWNISFQAVAQIRGQTFGNNPWKVNETDDEFRARKKIQLEVILEAIARSEKEPTGPDGTLPPMPLSFFNLQEVDFVYPKYKDILSEWQHALDAKGWSMVISRPQDNVQPMIILYNTKKLTPTKSYALFPATTGNHKNRALACDFTVLDVPPGSVDPKTVTVVNAHLAFGEDYHQVMEQYQRKQIAADQMTIIAGDLNARPNDNIPGVIGDFTLSTVLVHDATAKNKLGVAEKGYVTFYDGCLASPTRGTYVTIVEDELRFFVLDRLQDVIYFRLLNPAYAPHPEHESRIGEAWRRRNVYHLDDFYELCAIINDKIQSNKPSPAVVEAYQQLIQLFLTQQPDAKKNTYTFSDLIEEWCNAPQVIQLMPLPSANVFTRYLAHHCWPDGTPHKAFIDELLKQFGEKYKSKLSPLPIDGAKLPAIFQSLLNMPAAINAAPSPSV